MAIFFNFFFFRQYRLRKCRLWYSRTKKTHFQPIKKRSSKSRKIDIFPKGLTHGFSPKIGHVSNLFFLGNIGQENVFYDILEQKNAFLGYKNKKLKWSKNRNFSTGVNPWFFFQKWQFFQVYFNRRERPGKCLLWYSRTKKRLPRL